MKNKINNIVPKVKRKTSTNEFDPKKFITDVYNCQTTSYTLNKYLNSLAEQHIKAGEIEEKNIPKFYDTEFGRTYKQLYKKILPLPIEPTFYNTCDSFKQIMEETAGIAIGGLVAVIILFVFLCFLFDIDDYLMMNICICVVTYIGMLFFKPIVNAIKYIKEKFDFQNKHRNYVESKISVERQNNKNQKINDENYSYYINKYNEYVQDINKNYDEYLIKRRIEISEKREPINKEMNTVKEKINLVNYTMDALYSLRVNGSLCLHPSYREIETISIIYGYFDTGRCKTLEGHEGAYNLYEDEKFKGIIVQKLINIETKLNELNATMYYVGKAINDCKYQLEELNNNMVSAISAIEKNSNSISASISDLGSKTDKVISATANAAYYSEISAKMNTINTYYQVFKDL